jgi:hypothetical protein
MLKRLKAPDPKASETSQDVTLQQESPSVPSLLASQASLKAGQLFGCYRKGDANDPDIYVAGVAAVLSEYPAEVVDHVCDPRTGLPRKLKWLPAIAEACDERLEFMKAAAVLRKKVERFRAIIADPDTGDYPPDQHG